MLEPGKLFGQIALILIAATACSGLQKQPEESSSTTSGANVLQYSGRIDFSRPEQPVLIWQGSSVSGHFIGRSFALEFADVVGEAWFELNIDGHSQVVDARGGQVAPDRVLDDTAHTFRLTKRSEANAGHARLAAIKTHLTPPSVLQTPQPLRLIFYGDSITAGACNEDGEEDQWDTRATHNALLSYAAVTAEALQAEYRNIAVSGMGISIGYEPVTALDVWNRLYPQPNAPEAVDASWQPDLVFINLGENDDSYTRNQQFPFPDDYAERYLQLVRQMRVHYPSAQFVILRGGMFGGAQSERLRAPWQDVVTSLRKQDDKVSSFVFSHWTPHHPRVADHRAMAVELVKWLKAERLVPLGDAT